MLLPARHGYQRVPALASWLRAGAAPSTQLIPTVAFRRTTRAPYSAAPENHFDTFKLNQKLQDRGFSPEQSEAVMGCLQDVIKDSILNFKKEMVTKSDQEKNVYMYKVDFAQLKSEIQMLEKNDYTMMKSDITKLVAEVEKLKQKLKEEITRSQAGVRLDMNLEKGRIRDESGTQMLRVKEANTKIEGEIANLRTQMETIKFQILQYMIGTITGTGALILAYMRMFR
ncbi:Protein fmp32, mitochondrial [Tieghemiomyces parasiticus]|uniref:Protein fmp32, mitochondrial n=1 Tax=Tieghemiomyces parasiticus TaxID=78921 RepID=A0A9W8AHL4_9FUNG|nr:Protein fmp32, mitochondrial [Tieghemiomyces parasiticus]